MDYKRIDVDSHLQEKPDTFTKRTSKRFKDVVPQLKRTPDGMDRWFINGNPGLWPALCEGVMFAVYDTRGRLVRTVLQDAPLDAGWHDVVFDGSGLASGQYFYRLQTETGTTARRLVLVK